ncbi:Aliphatic sulfonates import ATP-binding protein SsuB [Kordia antarctica]|uniref:Aliphatic sulfonates import ATP-binding protein SsuB n=1 Tax=Kordia antarctica TaxID=1218801 RepID=A0A7L4ZHT1_9FLAO|nr:ABC transporter ATP-binding protein [Kordia antarctica]QHI35776.1 Aliphatic sulfonates import ATP-binding protein SsuB [Kordia antarctica]
MKILEFISVNKTYQNNSVLENANFHINKGEFAVIVGTNGSGKSSILNAIAEIIKIDSGLIKRGVLKNEISYVRQDYRGNLLPWKNTFQNICLPLIIKGENKSNYEEKVNDTFKQFDIDLDLKKYPYQLSGGQQQQVAIVRGVINNPKLLLLDEPFASLDFGIKREVSKHILSYWKKSSLTVILVTHDIDEAIFLADRVLVINNKKIESIKVNLDRPRKIDLLASVEFGKIKSNIFKLLRYV